MTLPASRRGRLSGSKQMRDERFRAVHRGGLLGLQEHRLLAMWAAACAEHVLPLFGLSSPQDERPRQAVEAARAWSYGNLTVGEARATATEAHAAAREATEAEARYVARAAAHAVATAHMADHALEAAIYAVKAVKAATKNQAGTAVEQERSWQKARLPEEIGKLVLSTLEQK